jgi:hypothetical protein
MWIKQMEIKKLMVMLMLMIRLLLLLRGFGRVKLIGCLASLWLYASFTFLGPN